MTLDEKVDEVHKMIMTCRLSDLKQVVRKILVEQDRDTRHSCAEAVLDLDCDAYGRCINCKTWD